MSNVVLDTSAVLALLFGEPGADAVIESGGEGLFSTVSYSEAVTKSLDRRIPMETIVRSLAGLKLALVPFDENLAIAAAALRPSTQHLNFSFADRACLATAAIHKLPVLTADRDWLKVDLGIEIQLIR